MQQISKTTAPTPPQTHLKYEGGIQSFIRPEERRTVLLLMALFYSQMQNIELSKAGWKQSCSVIFASDNKTRNISTVLITENVFKVYSQLSQTKWDHKSHHGSFTGGITVSSW